MGFLQNRFLSTLFAVREGEAGLRSALDEGARDRRGSGLSLSPLPLESASVTLPSGIHPWQLFQADGYLYASGADGWLLRTADLEQWEDVPQPPVPELIDGALGGEWPNYHFQQTVVSGDTIATVVSIFGAHPEPAIPADDSELEATDGGWFAYSPVERCSEQVAQQDESHLLVSTTHTHRAPRAIDLELGPAHERYKESLVERVV